MACIKIVEKLHARARLSKPDAAHVSSTKKRTVRLMPITNQKRELIVVGCILQARYGTIITQSTVLVSAVCVLPVESLLVIVNEAPALRVTL